MLGGIDPIILFHYSRLPPETRKSLSKIPLVAEIQEMIQLPPIPIYLSEKLTGMFIDTENKNVDIETSTETTKDGGTPDANQKAISSTVSINLNARKDSVGMILLSALIDVVFQKVTSKEYGITYLNGATTVFNGLLHSYSCTQRADTDLMDIQIQLIRNTGSTQVRAPIPVIEKTTGALPTLGGGS